MSFATDIDKDYEEIVNVIDQYFFERYEAKSKNTIPNINRLVVGDTIEFELQKLEIEAFADKLSGLYYASYNYDLSFDNFEVDKSGDTASITVFENYDVIYNIAEKIDKEDPIVSKLRRLKHDFVLTKTNTGWKISEDKYNDLLWEFINHSNKSKTELMEVISENITNKDVIIQSEGSFQCVMAYDETTHEYNRDGVQAYAEEWALSRNPEYYDFGDYDCTNFVSQAIRHGSNAGFDGDWAPGGSGWFYLNENLMSASWTYVQNFYDFVMYYQVWNQGPEGCDDISRNEVEVGDVIQFQIPGEDDYLWDHSVIVTRIGFWGLDPEIFYSAHSNDTLNQPLSTVYYLDIRYIHIMRIDGELHLVYMPSIINSSTSTLLSIPEAELIFDNQAYPAPGTDLLTPTEATRIGYP